jgi:hypothetical protein
MTGLILIIVIAVIIVGVIVTRGKKPGGHLAAAQVSVDLDGAGGITVVPDPIEVDLGQEIEWSHNADRLQLRQKAGDVKPWPFLDLPPQAGKGQKARSGRMKPKHEIVFKKPYKYDVILTRDNQEFELDPDFFIRSPMNG